MREKGSTFINISGLTLGIACSLVLFLMIQHFTSYDLDQSKRDRIYRIVTESDGNNGKNHTAGVPTVFPDAFRNDFPEAEEVVFLSYRSESLVSIPQRNGEAKKFNEESGIVFTQPNYFKIFDRPILIGDAQKGLDEPNEAIISKAWALKYFGKEDAIGEVVKFDKREYKITAIMGDLPPATDFPFNLMLSYSTIKKEHEENGGWGSVWSDEQCYFLLKEGEDILKVESRLPAFLTKYIGKDNTNHKVYSAQPMKDFHYDERYEPLSYDTISPGMLMALGTIALILIITACINFINLATAEAIKRSKEVGIRKSLGSTRSQLIRQFLGETVLVTVLSMVISLGLAQLALSFLNPFLNLNLSIDVVSNQYLWFYIAGVTVFVSVLSGLYPAFVISGFNPALALKNLISNKNSSGYNLRRALVVLQFCISQLFIIGTIVVINQMNFFQSKELGFRRDAIITVPIPEEENPRDGGTSKMRTLRDELARSAGVEMASLSSTPPSSGNVSSTGFIFEGESDENRREVQIKTVDGNYIDLYDLKLIAGTGLQDLDSANGFVVNERLTKVAGMENPADIVGKVIRVWGRTLPVVGVVKDFHTVSLRRPMEATVLFNRLDGYYTLSLKINMANSKAVIENLKAKWEATYPEHIFDYQFLDDSIRRFYEGEKKMSVLLTIFSSMAIFIGCLGLFGLATFMANQKTKEIGVRKVLGASVESIVMLFSREYVKLIFIGFVLAAPFAWFVMNQFLSEFAYKIEIGPGIFLMALGATLVVAMLTVGYKSFRAAMANPVKSLRSE